MASALPWLWVVAHYTWPAQRENTRAWTAVALSCLAMVHRPRAWPAQCSVLLSTSVKCQNKSICKGNRLSLECDGRENSPLGLKGGGWAICGEISTLRATGMILEWITRVIWSLVTEASSFTHKTQVNRNGPVWSMISVKSSFRVEWSPCLTPLPLCCWRLNAGRVSCMLGECSNELHLQRLFTS